ncbi:hypothetical protein JO972_16645 [Verrucomicrobiaceae bacterium 5K15]|uniref:Uncharacterized protein n=1 Tax=Oceaniferula flava TaxID=2800421 RepID=A0AAE2SE88_9BACT|nr:hypothetical protein [Oceaniferula flavus]MBK1856595.1 hypothetical protein [Oceaniferula flavus]MBM1137903.1 hypothetical protein [Oceaniferula flavus]
MKIWRIKAPSYRSSKEKANHNGSISFPYGLPGVKCCGTWSGCDLLGIDCPQELRDVTGLNDSWPLKPKRLDKLREELRRFEGFSGLSIHELSPGARLMPPTFKQPHHKDNDFLWPALEAPVVSLRVAALLSRICPDDFEAVPLPNTPDWVLIIIRAKSKPPIERRSDRHCKRCGRGNRVSNSSDFVVFEDMVPNAGIFCLDTTLHLLISDELKNYLSELDPSNIIFDLVEVQQN